MQLYDYLFRFANETEAINALPDWYTPAYSLEGVDNFPGQWNTSCVLPVTAIAKRATYDAEGNQLTPQITIPGYWLMIAVREPNDDLYAMAVQETLRPETPTPFKDTILRTKLDKDFYKSFLLWEPVYAGSAYVWRSEEVDPQEIRKQLSAHIDAIRKIVQEDNFLGEKDKNKIEKYLNAIKAISEQIEPDNELQTIIAERLNKYLLGLSKRFGERLVFNKIFEHLDDIQRFLDNIF